MKFHLVKWFESCVENIVDCLSCNFNNGISFVFLFNTASGPLPGYILQKGRMRQ